MPQRAETTVADPAAQPGSSPDGAAAPAIWSDRLAVEVEAALGADAPARPIVCASGISPSGPIHMGNLREVFTTHLVAEALRARGHEVVHLHSWDDYDRLRKVPAGVDASFAEHIGRPLAGIPDPWDPEAGSYAEHWMREFTGAMRELGIEMHEVRQSEHYPAGTYNARIRRRDAGARADLRHARRAADRRAPRQAASRSAAARTSRSSRSARPAAATTRR